MRKNFLALFIAIFMFWLPLSAQLKQVAEGPKFAEPDNGRLKLIQMENGNTVYFHLTPNEGINLRVYDDAHKEKIATSFDQGFERVKVARKEGSMSMNSNEENIESIFEINNDLVVLITEASGKKTDSYKLIIDLATGKPKEVKNIFSEKGQYRNPVVAKKHDWGKGYFVKASKQYILYNANHEEQFSLPTAVEGKKNFYMVDMVTLENDKMISFYEEYAEKTYEGKFYVSVLNKGITENQYAKISLPEDLLYSTPIIKYNPVSKKIMFLVIGKKETKRNLDYYPFLVMIDPESLKVDNIESFLPGEGLQTQYKERYKLKDDYNALPNDLYINSDGSVSIIYEEMMMQSTSSGHYSRQDTRLGKLLIVTLDKEGKFLSNFITPKVHWYIFDFIDKNYHSQSRTAGQELWRGNHFKSYAYIPGPKGQYILFNDTERNDEVKNDKFAEIQAVSGCDAFVYKFSPGEVFPKRSYLFGKPDKGNILAMFLVSDYDPVKNIYVTLKLVKESARDHMISLVWLQPE